MGMAGTNTATTPQRRARTWPWAAGAVFTVALVLGGALAGRHIVSTQRHAAAIVPHPSVAVPGVVNATNPTIAIERLALDSSSGHLIALAGPPTPDCPPTGVCPAGPAPTTLLVLDGATGATLARTPLTGEAAAAAQSALVVTDTTRHVAYAVSPETITTFSTVTGATLSTVALPAASGGGPITGGALDPARTVLFLARGDQLIAVDTTTGSILASQTLASRAAPVDGPVLDVLHDRLYMLEHDTPAGASEVVAYDAATLTPLGRISVPAGSRLGPLDPSARTLYLFAAGGATESIHTDTLTSGAAPSGQAAVMPTLRDALALGWNVSLGHSYTADASGVTVRDASSGRALAALPVRAAWATSVPLLTDPTRGLLYLLTPRGTLLIVRDGAPAGALTAGTAVTLARAALADFLPDTNQDPPFVTPQTFPLAPGTRPASYWVHFSDLGWRGPYPGSAATDVVDEPGHPGAYRVTFTLTWNQLFVRSHVWVCEVAPTGDVRLLSQSGDAVP